MSVLYFPGCTLKDKASNFDASTVSSMAALGVELKELQRWNCCGTVFSMASDDLMQQLAPARTLLRAEQQGDGILLAPCSMCFNTLRRAQRMLLDEPEHMEKIRLFMSLEAELLQADVQVMHPLSYLRDQLGWQALRQGVTRPLQGLKLAAYYGCLLTRPLELGIDDTCDTSIFEELLSALGAEPVAFDEREACCGSYQTLTNKAVTLRRCQELLRSAAHGGAQALVTSCPLCAYNLDQMQREAVDEWPDLHGMPVFYFTELMALATGLGWDPDWTARHQVDPLPLLQAHGLA